ncbi:MAG: HAD family hydrolase [Acidimicrobiales bacterium]
MLNPDQIRLVATDLDGTLLRSDSWVSERTAATLARVAAAGIEIVAATGRSHPSAIPRLAPLGSIRWLIASNGATLYDLHNDEVVERRMIAASDVRDIVASIESELGECGYSWETVDGIEWDDYYIALRTSLGTPKSIDVNRPTQVFVPGHDDLSKIMVVSEQCQGRELADLIRPLIGPDFNVASSGAIFMEITAGGANKAYMLRDLCERLDIDRATTMGFGDQDNDLKMLEWVAHGFVMANGDPVVRAAVHCEAPDHEHDGVAQVLERYWPAD